MSIGEVLQATVYAVALVTAAGIAAAALSRWTDRDALDRALVATVAVIATLVGAGLVLGMAGFLTRWWYLGAVGALCVGGGMALVRMRRSPARVPAAWTLGGMAALGIAGVMASLASLPTVRAITTMDVDTRVYHFPNLLFWVREHSIWDLPFQNPGFTTATHPSNGEMSSIGLLFSTGADQLVYLIPIVFAALAVLACATITRELDGRPELGALTALALVSTPAVFATQSHSLATDLVAASCVLAGVAALMRAKRERDVRWVVVAGAALGLGLGAKYTAFALTALVVVAAVGVLRPRRRALWLAPGLVLLAGPWFARNALATGNPLFPQGVSIGGREILPGGQGPLLELSTTVADHVLAGHFSVLGRLSRLGLDLYGPALLLMVAGVITVALRKDRRRDQLAIAALAVVGAGAYAFTPYTGAGPEGLDFLMGSNLRYLIPAAMTGMALAAAVVPRRLLVLLVSATFVFGAYHLVKGYGFRLDLTAPIGGILLAAIAGLVLTLAVVGFGQRRLHNNPFVFVVIAGLAVLSCSAVLARVNGEVAQTDLAEAIARTGSKEVLVLGVSDIRSLLGPDLDVGLRTLSAGGAAGELPLDDPDSLDRALAELDVDVMAVQFGTVAVPEGWEPDTDELADAPEGVEPPGDGTENVPQGEPPSGWTVFEETPQGVVYVRDR